MMDYCTALKILHAMPAACRSSVFKHRYLPSNNINTRCFSGSKETQRESAFLIFSTSYLLFQVYNQNNYLDLDSEQ